MDDAPGCSRASAGSGVRCSRRHEVDMVRDHETIEGRHAIWTDLLSDRKLVEPPQADKNSLLDPVG